MKVCVLMYAIGASLGLMYAIGVSLVKALSVGY